MNFWKQFPPATCLPDNCNCEFIQDAFIVQPSAFWSSLSFFIFAIVFYRSIEKKSVTLKLWFFSFCLLGIASHFAHASFIEPALALDFAGIVLVMSFFFILKWLSRWTKSLLPLLTLLMLYTASLWFAFYSLEKWFKVGLCVLVFALALGEIVHSQSKAFLKAKDLHRAIAVIFISFGLFLFDELKVNCNPYSVIQGHSFWHIGAGLSIFFYGKWRFQSAPEI